MKKSTLEILTEAKQILSIGPYHFTILPALISAVRSGQNYAIDISNISAAAGKGKTLRVTDAQQLYNAIAFRMVVDAIQNTQNYGAKKLGDTTEAIISSIFGGLNLNDEYAFSNNTIYADIVIETSGNKKELYSVKFFKDNSSLVSQGITYEKIQKLIADFNQARNISGMSDNLFGIITGAPTDPDGSSANLAITKYGPEDVPFWDSYFGILAPTTVINISRTTKTGKISTRQKQGNPKTNFSDPMLRTITSSKTSIITIPTVSQINQAFKELNLDPKVFNYDTIVNSSVQGTSPAGAVGHPLRSVSGAYATVSKKLAPELGEFVVAASGQGGAQKRKTFAKNVNAIQKLLLKTLEDQTNVTNAKNNKIDAISREFNRFVTKIDTFDGVLDNKTNLSESTIPGKLIDWAVED